MVATTRKETKSGFQVPKLKRFTKPVGLEQLGDTTEADKEAKKLKEEKTLPSLHEQVIIALSFIETTEADLKKIEKADRVVQAIKAEEVKKAKQAVATKRRWLTEYINHEFAPFRWTAWVAMLTHYFSKKFKSKEEARSWIANLCQAGHIQKKNEGPLELLGERYTVNESADLGEPEMKQVREAAKQLDDRVAYAEKLCQREKINVVLEKGKLSTAKFFKGEPGFYSVMPSPNGDYHPEGALLVRSNGERVFVQEAIGSFREDMEELKKLDRFLLLFTLNWEEIVPDFFIKKGQFTEREAELLMEFWKLLKSGSVWKRKKEVVLAQREKCAAGTNINQKEFLLEEKAGNTFLEYDEAWNWFTPKKEKKKIYNLFFQIERREENSQKLVGLVKFPPWLNEFFSDCRGYFPEGNLPKNLQAVLGQIRRQEERRLQVQSHT